jgi:hypothetical protein
MTYRAPEAAPASRIAEERRGAVQGRFCNACGSVYALFASRHTGKPLHGKDHIAAPCVHEGDRFVDGEDWWEPAVAVLPPPPPAEPQGEGSAAS